MISKQSVSEQYLLPHSFCVPGIHAQLCWVLRVRVFLKTVIKVVGWVWIYLKARLGKDLLPSPLTCYQGSVLTGWGHLQLLAMWASPLWSHNMEACFTKASEREEPESERESEREKMGKTDVKDSSNLILEVTSHHFILFYWLENQVMGSSATRGPRPGRWDRWEPFQRQPTMIPMTTLR